MGGSIEKCLNSVSDWVYSKENVESLVVDEMREDKTGKNIGNIH